MKRKPETPKPETLRNDSFKIFFLDEVDSFNKEQTKMDVKWYKPWTWFGEKKVEVDYEVLDEVHSKIPTIEEESKTLQMASDSLQSIQKKPKFKVGEKVVYVGPLKWIREKKSGKVTEVTNFGFLVDFGKSRVWADETHLKKYTPAKKKAAKKKAVKKSKRGKK